jgi:beta-N-acetylhexosaminidase
LASVGIDLSFSPVLDVDSNPQNPIIGGRAFGPDSDTVIHFALPFMRGLQDTRVIACGKHFPGHGDTDCDSHLELPIVHRSRQEIERVELPPFQAAITAGIPALMSAHVLYTALDERNPATLSRPILQDTLRRTLGFSGVIVSDDLEMRALREAGTVADCAVQALQAGIDWTVVCNDFDESVRTFEQIRTALLGGTLDREAVERSAQRIRALRRPKPHAAVTLPVLAHEQLNQRLRHHV